MDLVRHIPNEVNDLSGVNAMHQEPAIKWVPLIIGLLPIFAILCAVLFFMNSSRYYTRLKQERTAYMLEIAQQLGYTPEVHLVQGQKCWDPDFDGSEACGLFIIFTTQMAQDELRTKIEGIGLSGDLMDPSDIAPNALFTDINYATNKTLTIIGNNKVDNSMLQYQISAKSWSLKDEQERQLHINLYDTQALDAHLDLDGQLVVGNVISILIRLGRVPLWAHSNIYERQ